MDWYALRILRSQPLRLALTIGGIGLCVLLMLVLFSVYRGVADGSVEYIRRNKADLWVLQRNAWNILRGTSLLPASYRSALEEIPGVETAAPVLLTLSAIKLPDRLATVFLSGYDQKVGLGGPPRLSQGRAVQSDDEIVLDRAFASKLAIKPGDGVWIQDDTLRVVGLSEGTNAAVLQYAFVTLRRARSLLGLPNIVTCYLVKVKEGNSIDDIARKIKEKLPGVETYSYTVFLANNVREMESGFLPFLFIIAAIGAIVLTTILSLLLAINILERRKDFAVLKALGARLSFLRRLVTAQAMLTSSGGVIFALLMFFPLTSLLARMAPEISMKLSCGQIARVIVLVSGISLVSSFIATRRLRRIYPLEAFS